MVDINVWRARIGLYNPRIRWSGDGREKERLALRARLLRSVQKVLAENSKREERAEGGQEEGKDGIQASARCNLVPSNSGLLNLGVDPSSIRKGMLMAVLTVLVYLLLLCGDVELNPGPTLSDRPTMPELISIRKKDKAFLRVIDNITAFRTVKCDDFAQKLLRPKNSFVITGLRKEKADDEMFVRAVLNRWLSIADDDPHDPAVPRTWGDLAECVEAAGLDTALAQAIRDSCIPDVDGEMRVIQEDTGRRLKVCGLKMFLCGPPHTGKTTTMDRLTEQIRHLQTSEILIPGLKAWKFERLSSVYNLILTSPRSTPTSTVQNELMDDKSGPATIGQQRDQLASLVKDGDRQSVREDLDVFEEIILIHMIDCGVQPECHEILPLLLGCQVLGLIFLNLTHDLDRALVHSKYKSELTPKDVLQHILSSLSLPHSHSQSAAPSLPLSHSRSAVLLIGTDLNQISDEDVVTLNKSVKEAFSNFSRILCPAGVQGNKERYIVPLNTGNTKELDIQRLWRVVLENIEGRFRYSQEECMSIPAGWLKLLKLLQSRDDEGQGWCTMKTCIPIAQSCHISKDQLPTVLQFIHRNYGTLLYYPSIPGLCDKVIYDPNIILHPFKSIFDFVFTKKPSDCSAIRKTGFIPHELLDECCQMKCPDHRNPLPTEEIIPLLKDHFILYEKEKQTAKKSYFMPSLLEQDTSVAKDLCNPTSLDSLSPAPIHLVPKDTGHVPLGLFPALVVKMSSVWELCSKPQFRNRVKFFARPKEKGKILEVELRHHSSHIELRHLCSKTKTIDSRLLISCCKNLLDGLREVKSKYPHMKEEEWDLGFFCPVSLEPEGHPRPAQALCLTDECKLDYIPEQMVCNNEDCCHEIFDLECKHQCWFEEMTVTATPMPPTP